MGIKVAGIKIQQSLQERFNDLFSQQVLQPKGCMADFGTVHFHFSLKQEQSSCSSHVKGEKAGGKLGLWEIC